MKLTYGEMAYLAKKSGLDSAGNNWRDFFYDGGPNELAEYTRLVLERAAIRCDIFAAENAEQHPKVDGWRHYHRAEAGNELGDRIRAMKPDAPSEGGE